MQEIVPIGVVPQENTIFGSVIETHDGLRRLNCGFVKGEITLQIQHCLLVKEGVQLHEIESVLSHEQVRCAPWSPSDAHSTFKALGQCQDFLSAYLPNATRVKTPSTASAARSLLTSPRSCAAICSKVCATMFEELEILREGIQDEPSTCISVFLRFCP